jgi:hypothetical protein
LDQALADGLQLGGHELREKVRLDFRESAWEIVSQMRELLAQALTDRQRRELSRLPRREIDKTVSALDQAFRTKRMGLRELADMARRELAILAIRKTTPRYSVDLLAGGIEPIEYFNRFYRQDFLRFQIPAARVGAVDPNLHMQLVKRGEFPLVKQSLASGPAG